MADDFTLATLDDQAAAASLPGSGASPATPHPAYVPRLFQIESGNDPRNVTGSNRGLGQFSPDLERRYGITNWLDPNQQRQAVEREYAEHYSLFNKVFGQAPTMGQSYFMHQQGPTGGIALMSADPNTPAWQVIRPYYKSDRIARLAITGNVPSDHPLYRQSADNITAGDFRNMWINKFERTNTNMPTMVAGASGSGPVASSPPGGVTASASGVPAPATPGQFDSGHETAALLAANALRQEQQQIQPAQFAQLQMPQMQSPKIETPQAPLPLDQQQINQRRLRNVLAGRGQQQASIPMPPSVAARLATLVGRG